MASLRYLNMEMLHEQRKQLQPRGRQNEHDGLFTNRLLWLGASAAAFFLWGSGCRNLALRAFMNKPWRGSRTDMEGRSLSLPAPVSIRMAWRVCFHKPAVETQENIALRLTEHTSEWLTPDAPSSSRPFAWGRCGKRSRWERFYRVLPPSTLPEAL